MPRPATGQTPLRNVRIADSTWSQAKAIAKERGETLTSVIEVALLAYIRKHGHRQDADR